MRPDENDAADDPAPNEEPACPPKAKPAQCRPACPVCGGRLIEVRAKLQCAECHSIIEACCEGGPET